MLPRQSLLLLLLPLAACASRGNDWPSLSPRPGEVSPMVPRNVAGTRSCPQPADCAPPAAVPAPDLIAPPAAPPAAAAVLAELDRIESLVASVEAAIAPARAQAQRSRAAAAAAGPESAAQASAVAAEARLAALVQPLPGAAFRLESLAAATADAADRAAYADRLATLAQRIASLDPQ